MNINKITLPEPPNVLKSIKNGFDAITKHLILLIFPIGLDLFLWFGPHLQIKSLIEGLIVDMSDMSELMPADFGEVMEAGQEIWMVAAERINLLIGLRSLPVGIFSLFTSILPIENPLGLKDNGQFHEPFLIGSYVNVEIEGKELKGIYVIPREAIRENDKVWLMNAENQLETRPVSIIQRFQEHVFVNEGLENGERVVTSSIPLALPGMELKEVGNE